MMNTAQDPILSLSALHRALSEQRLNSYKHASDRDEVDGVARYAWNMALSAALQSSLHVFEITLRNAIFNTSVKLVDTTTLLLPDIPCWLDAQDSTLLYENEIAEVHRAKTYLSHDPRRRTPGHLVAKLSFGFWVQLTSRAYSDLRQDGPKLWPRGLSLVFPFRWPPGSKRVVPNHSDRQMIYERLHRIRQLRNRIAHHEPIWDLDLGSEYTRILEVLGWMSPKMVSAVDALDTFPSVLAGGAQPYRHHAEILLRGEPSSPGSPSPTPRGPLSSR